MLRQTRRHGREQGGLSVALGIRADGRKDVLGWWIEQTEGAKFWLKVFNELKKRGCTTS